MFRRLLSLLPFVLLLALLPTVTSSQLVADSDLASTEAEVLAQADDLAPPPLPANCGQDAVPTDYNQPVSCLNGYVYLNGSPVAGATVSIFANGESITAQRGDNGAASEQPYFTASLSNEPLNVQPGQEVTITAEVDGQSKTQTFIAQPGGQQIDVVLPQSRVEAAWQRVDLAARSGHAMAYDAARERVVLFGGYGEDYLGYTWEWDGNSWIQKSPLASPSPRGGHAMVYDAARERVVLFGGSGSSGDTWEWDGETWIERTPPVSPSPRSDHAMVYDTARERVVLFGSNYDYPYDLGDTWEWDGMTWEQQQPSLSPSERGAHAMGYDERGGKVVLFGGICFDTACKLKSDTWEWNGNIWTELLPLISPLARRDHAMAYDAARSRVVLFGGRSYSGHSGGFADTWEWDGSAWIEQNPPLSPSARRDHAMVYDAERERIVLFGGYDGSTTLGDTWEWDGNEWSLRATTEQPASRRFAALSYESNGQSLLFGGKSRTWFADTYRWTGNGWQQLTPANTPPERSAHRLARNADGSQLLLFGGEGSDGGYRDDTWLWNGQDWLIQSPGNQPSARGEYALTYDEEAGIWLLFGGRNDTQYLEETWQYDGSNWLLRNPNTSPSPRAGATLSYDAARGRAVLIGGRNVQGYLDEIWEWDGTDWVEVTPNGTGPTARSGHEAAYDRTRQVVVIAGGQDTNGPLNDMWEWNGSFWRQRASTPNMPARTNFAMTYDAEHDRLISFGGEEASGDLVEGTYVYEVLGSPMDAPPVATINRIQPRDARHGIDTITFQGSGADADASDRIEAYRWKHDGEVISTQATFSMTASAFPLGAQTITLEVQDDEGTWSPQVEQTIYIRDGEAGTGSGNSWTLLIYAVADNNLDPWMGDYENISGMLYHLRTAGAQENVQVGILYDGPRRGDTQRYILREDGSWSEEQLGEARMDEIDTLRDFIQWGYQSFDSDYYALALADHANGIVGFGQDESTDSSGRAFLTPIELRTALQAGTGDGSRKLDVLHYDGSSFGLLENAAIAKGLAEYVVASPNTGWGIFGYDLYRQQAASATNPREYAKKVAETYAIGVATDGLPYSISVFDMAYFSAVDEGVSHLGDSLLAYRQANPPARTAELRLVRNASQKYDSGGQQSLEIDNEDSYVDLMDLTLNLQAQISDTAVISATEAINSAIDDLVIYESHASGEFDYYDPSIGSVRPFNINLEHSHGIGIFYPPRATTNSQSAYQQYVQNRLFDSTRDSGWRSFLAQGLPPQLGGDPLALPNDVLIPPLLDECVQSAKATPTPVATMTPSSDRQQLFLPLVARENESSVPLCQP